MSDRIQNLSNAECGMMESLRDRFFRKCRSAGARQFRIPHTVFDSLHVRKYVSLTGISRSIPT